MFTYWAYGFGIHSAIPLPEFVAADVSCDVQIHLLRGDAQFAKSMADLGPECFNRCTWQPDEIVLSAREAGVFRIRGGQDVEITALPDVDERILSLFVAGSVMALVSYQRGLLPLHASAIAIEGRAIAFVGESGAGKSTTAAALQACGYGIVTDDVLPVRVEGARSWVSPAFPQLKLTSAAAAALGHDQQSIFSLHSRLNKYGHRVTETFDPAELPLQSVYVLDIGETLMIQPLGPQEALLAAIANAYGARPLKAVIQSPSYFAQIMTLLKTVKFYRLTRPANLQALPELAQFVTMHHRQESTPSPDLVPVS
jgi:hypothetical protein